MIFAVQLVLLATFLVTETASIAKEEKLNVWEKDFVNNEERMEDVDGGGDGQGNYF